jgi:hypothetical protein
MRRYYQIDGHPELLRDPHSKGLILTDRSALQREKAKKNSRAEREQLKQDVETLKTKFESMENTLKLILAAVTKETDK